jgi:hypothetical protein
MSVPAYDDPRPEGSGVASRLPASLNDAEAALLEAANATDRYANDPQRVATDVDHPDDIAGAVQVAMDSLSRHIEFVSGRAA